MRGSVFLSPHLASIFRVARRCRTSDILTILTATWSSNEGVRRIRRSAFARSLPATIISLNSVVLTTIVPAWEGGLNAGPETAMQSAPPIYRQRVAMNYDDYVAVFNTGDDAALVERFFADDVTFSGGTREAKGKQALLAFLRWAHDGVREVMRPQRVLREKDVIFAEIDMDFHATKERPEFPFGHLHPGDLVTVKFFVTYLLRDGKVAELKSMTWPPERGVTKLPRLGGHPSQIAAFHAYCAAFSNADCDRFSAFYQPDVVLELNKLPPIRGRDGIVGFYRPMFERVRECLTLHSVNATDDAIRLHATARFTAIMDAPDFVIAPLSPGDYIEGRVWVDYTLHEGLITHIKVARDGDMIRYPAIEPA
jgi:ketosteroid isomerase-like protein